MKGYGYLHYNDPDDKGQLYTWHVVVTPPVLRPMACAPFFVCPTLCWWARTIVESLIA
jgi:hypothetical protein